MTKNDININNIKNTIQLILNKNHKIPEKKKMIYKPYGTRPVIEMACPICGDSEKNINKKRGNLYLNNLFYVCYNCGSKMNYIKFIETFNLTINMEEKIHLYNYIDNNNIHQKETNFDLSGLNNIMNLEDVIDFYNKKKDKIYNITKINKNSKVFNYLKSRYIFNYDNIYEGLYKITDKWIEPVLLILNKYDNKLLSFQIRNLKNDKNKRIYKIYDFKSIYDYVYSDSKLKENEYLPYNKLSHLYNILNIDFYDKITIFEGYLDSIFFPNSIGTTGVDTDYHFLIKSDELKIRFLYDNDKIGKYKSIQKLDNGFSVFLWNKLFNDISKGNHIMNYKLKNKIKDLNDLVKLYKDSNIFETLKLNDYFSIDKFDKIWF